MEKADALAVLACAMRRHELSLKVQTCGLQLLAQACSGTLNQSTLQKQAARADGTVDLVLSNMHLHRSEAKLQRWGAAALSGLCFSAAPAELQSILVKSGGITAVIQAMSDHLTHRETQQEGAAFLKNMAVRDIDHAKVGGENIGIQDCIGESGGAEALVAAMQEHERDLDVQLHCLGA